MDHFVVPLLGDHVRVLHVAKWETDASAVFNRQRAVRRVTDTFNTLLYVHQPSTAPCPGNGAIRPVDPTRVAPQPAEQYPGK